MNILFISSHLDVGGVTSYLLTLSMQLIRMGHRVGIVYSNGTQTQEFEQIGVRLYPLLPRTKNEMNPALLWKVGAISKIIKDEQWNIVHAHSRVSQVIASLSAWHASIPFVSTAHGFFKRRLSRRLFPAWGQRVVAISDLVAEELIKTHKVARDKVRVIYNGLDFNDFACELEARDAQNFRSSLNIPENAYVIVNVSRLVADKGHDYLIDAMKTLSQKDPDIYLLIAGEGRQKEALRRKITSMKLSSRVRLFENRVSALDLYRIADVFIQPATYREGFGLTLLESMAARVPIIATDIWAINQIIRHQVTGLLVPPKDAKAITTAVLRLRQDQELSQRLANNAYEHARGAYDASRMAKEVLGVYQELLS